MLKAVIATLVLGSASLASADTRTRDHRNDDVYGHASGDARYDRADRFASTRAVLLANNVQLAESRDGRPAFIRLDARQNIRRLRLDLQQGRTFVNSINVVFNDGHRETIAVNQALSRRDPSITVALPHGGIQGVFIDTEPMRQGRNAGFRRTSSAVIDIVGLRAPWFRR